MQNPKEGIPSLLKYEILKSFDAKCQLPLGLHVRSVFSTFYILSICLQLTSFTDLINDISFGLHVITGLDESIRSVN